MNRWQMLNAREKEVVWRYVVLGEKRYTVGRNCGISRTRICQIIEPIYRMLGVRDSIGLAFFVGRNYERIEFDAVALGFELPKQEVKEIA